MSTTLTIMGCGSSGGVPRIGNNWGACDPANAKNRRRRCSVLITRKAASGERTDVVIDTGADFREQMLAAGLGRLDGVLYTHDHADHTHGIDDLRMVALNQRARVPVWANERTANTLTNRFSYCFYTPPESDYPPILDLHRLQPGEVVDVAGAGGTISALPFEVQHGAIRALGFRIGGCAYTPDINGVPERSLPALDDLDVWIIDALRYRAHPSHFNLEQALAWIERMAPRRAIITNMHVDLDYETLARELPAGVEPAYDGMCIAIEQVEHLPQSAKVTT